jgi:hypothetical protein
MSEAGDIKIVLEQVIIVPFVIGSVGNEGSIIRTCDPEEIAVKQSRRSGAQLLTFHRTIRADCETARLQLREW